MKREREDDAGEDGSDSEFVTKEQALVLMRKLKEQEDRLNDIVAKSKGQEASASSTASSSKKAKVEKTGSGKKFEFEKTSKGDWFAELSSKRRVTVSQWNSKPLISIREYYEKNGEMLPGKKGISLSKEQFRDIISMAPQIEEILDQM